MFNRLNVIKMLIGGGPVATRRPGAGAHRMRGPTYAMDTLSETILGFFHAPHQPLEPHRALNLHLQGETRSLPRNWRLISPYRSGAIQMRPGC
jgi:hypothetical protein